MAQVIIGIIIIVAVLLVLVVMAQNSKGGGLTGAATGASQLMGAKRTTDFLEKLTWALALTVLGISLMANVVIKPSSAAFESPNVKSATESPAPAAPATPGKTDTSAAAPAGGAQTPAQDAPATTPQDTTKRP